MLDENDLSHDITLMYMQLPKSERALIGHKFGKTELVPGYSLNGLFIKCSFMEEDCNDER